MAPGLYDAAIKAAARTDKGRGALDAPDRRLLLDNPLCGDRVRLDVAFDDAGRIEALAHETKGCLLTRAAAAVAVDVAPGLDASALRDLRASFAAWLEGARADAPDPRLEIFAPVRAVKSRHACVLLPFADLDDPDNGLEPERAREEP